MDRSHGELRGGVIGLAILALLGSFGCVSMGERTEPSDSVSERIGALVVERLLFGSCLDQDREAPILDRVVASRPDLFVFLGDNIYADTDEERVLRSRYAQLGDRPSFQQLRDLCPILATWDDHDYGRNDAGAEYSLKEISQAAFCDFFEVPEDSPRRRRGGVYDAVIFGPPGRRVQVILLDTRFHRSPLKRQTPRPSGRGPYVPEPDADATMLGEDQWRWLEEELGRPAEVRILVSSIQFVAREHGWECWGNFPGERARMFEAISRAGSEGVIFLSGDRHHGELSALAPGDESPLPYPLYDLTSSSLNRPRGEGVQEANRYRVGEIYGGENFGEVAIEWRDVPSITLRLRDLAGNVRVEHSFPLSHLSWQR